ncbi:LexA family transcriptional regulator [Methylorubrum zatmanii]
MVTDHASDLTELGRRLSLAVEQAGGRTVVSREADVPLSSLDRYLKGKSEAPAFTLARIARACQVSMEVLLDPTSVKSGDLTKLDLMIIEKETGRHLPVEAKSRTQSQSQEIYKRADTPMIAPDAITADGEHFVRIPRFDVRASAGPGVAPQPSDLIAQSDIAFRDAWLRALGVSPDNAQFLVADGDSMEPTIKDRDLLLIDRRIDRVVSNSIYVVVLAGHVMVKRLQLLFDGSILLISDNDRYQPERIDKSEVDRLQVEGRVRWFGRAL